VVPTLQQITVWFLDFWFSQGWYLSLHGLLGNSVLRVYCFLHRSCMMHVCMGISADGKGAPMGWHMMLMIACVCKCTIHILLNKASSYFFSIYESHGITNMHAITPRYLATNYLLHYNTKEPITSH
jgi:hypothetical protein